METIRSDMHKEDKGYVNECKHNEQQAELQSVLQRNKHH